MIQLIDYVVGPSPATRTSPGISELPYTGLKELARYKFLCTSSTEDVGGPCSLSCAGPCVVRRRQAELIEAATGK